MAIMQRQNADSYFRRISFLKKLFWLYFLLLIFEGALRKWVAPQLSAPLMIIRDPVSIWIIWEAYRTSKWPERWTVVISFLTVGFIGLFLVQSIVGDNPWFAGVFGLTSYLIPFPVLFIMGENLDEEDLRKFGAFTLWLVPPMALLEMAQYVSPSGSFLNRGAYEGGGQIGYVGEHVRASGTFSFSVGSASFAVFAGAFILYGLIKEGFAKKWLLWAACISLAMSIPMVGSRGLIFQMLAMLACIAIGAFIGISQFARIFRILMPLLLALFVVSLLPVFENARNSLAERFETAERGVEGNPLESLQYRLLRPITDKLESVDREDSWLGIGMGRGAGAVQALLQARVEFAAGEDDFSRVITEMGLVPGLLFELFRLSLAALILGQAVRRMWEHEPLALLLAPLGIFHLLFSTWEQTTLRGFAAIALGFMIAAAKTRKSVENVAFVHPLVRRQQILRERLHRR